MAAAMKFVKTAYCSFKTIPVQSITACLQKKLSTSSSSWYPRQPPSQEKGEYYELEYPAHVKENEEVMVPPPKETYTGVHVEESAEEWKYVERLLPDPWIPKPPKHAQYPTPSGWFPPAERRPDLPYFVKRTRFHNFPLYLEIKDGGTRKFTLIRNIEGNIWDLEKELNCLVEKASKRRAVTSVDEVCKKIRIKGVFLDEVAKFLAEKGL